MLSLSTYNTSSASDMTIDRFVEKCGSRISFVSACRVLLDVAILPAPTKRVNHQNNHQRIRQNRHLPPQAGECFPKFGQYTSQGSRANILQLKQPSAYGHVLIYRDAVIIDPAPAMRSNFMAVSKPLQ